MKSFAAALLAAAIAAACGTTQTRRATLGPASDSCLDKGSDCARDGECCSLWCVNGSCAMREGELMIHRDPASPAASRERESLDSVAVRR
jgi:hypothetical protein